MKSIFLSFFKVLVSIVILWFLFRSLDLKGTIHLVIDSDKSILIIVLVILMLQILLANFRWWTVLSNLKIISSFKEALKILWIGLFFNQILPSSMGGDAFRSYYIYKKVHKISYSIVSVLIDRVIGLIALVLFVLSTLPITLDLINQPAAKLGFIVIAFISFLAIPFIFIVDKLSNKLSNWGIVKGLYEFSSKSRLLILSISPGIKLVSISLLIHMLTIISIFLLSISMQINISFLGVLIIMPLASLLMTVPISIAGWGVREGVMIIGFGFLGVTPESALAISLLYGLIMLVISLPGVVIWLLDGHPYLHKVK